MGITFSNVICVVVALQLQEDGAKIERSGVKLRRGRRVQLWG